MITTYHQAFLVRGGGEYEIFSVADSLKQRGMIVDIYGPYARSIDDYDVVLHFSVHGGGLELLETVKGRGKPVALWPNLWVNESATGLDAIVNRHVSLADAVIFKSAAEQQHFARHFGLPAEKARRITVGADAAYRRPAPPGLFKSLYGVDRYAIWFGVIEPNKNQLAAVRVLREKGIPLVLVGRSRDEAYYQACRVAGGDNVLFIKGLPQKSEIVRAALKEALFYVEMSHEPPGLSSIEAGLAGCRLLLSDSEWSREHFGDAAIYADSADEADIARGVDAVLAMPRENSALVDGLSRFCLPEAIDPLIATLQSITK
ncbi:glycosyltransferase [Burkholderia glumae]|nr:glycosyltransferase family 4 protein [Burkholderia glumae]RQZ73826.1 glycosyltransferase [Burkholderia glumae]UVS85986.1 glycosyltransferase [Burkholderia glumae]